MDETTDMVKRMRPHHEVLRPRELRLVHSLPRGHGVAAQDAAAVRRRAAATTQDIDMVDELAKNMLGRTFCPLGDAAAMPTIAFVEKFRDEFEAKIGARLPSPAARPLASW